MMDHQFPVPLLAGLVAFLAAILVTDLGSRRIPNSLVLLAIGFSLLLRIATDGPGGGLMAGLAGGLAGLALFLPFYIAGGMGAGDVKAMAACGCFLGPALALLAAGLTLIAGAVLAIGLVLTRYLVLTLPISHRASGVLAGFRSAEGIPYAAAIVLGCMGSLLLARQGLASFFGG
jgi:prepilin peptidase CpaA